MGPTFESSSVTLREIEKYQEFAREHKVNLILGSVALKNEGNKKNTNTCFIINRLGEIIKRYDKKYMYRVRQKDYSVDESIDTLAGTEPGIVEIDGIKVGIGICFDLRFPEYFRELLKLGAEVFFLPAHFNKNTGLYAWESLVSARAIENQTYFCACNQTGGNTLGNSKIISYDGRILKEMDKEEGILEVELNLEKQRKFRQEFPVLEQIKGKGLY